MKKINFKASLPHLLAIGIFLVISIIYCLPLFQGMVVYQHDMLGTKGATQQSFEFYDKFGHYPLWTNSLFSGMPTFQIIFAGKYNIGIGWLHNVFTGFLPGSAGLFFLSCIGFYILSQVLKLKPWVGIFGSLAYAFASYNAIISVVGHITKFATMGYAPAVIAGLILLMKRKYVLGFASTLLFSTLFFLENHMQMAYYFGLVMICLGIGFLVKTIMEKNYKHFFYAASLATVALVISLCTFSVVLLPTAEYAKETMRGGRSELTLDKNAKKSTGGLDKDYAFGWSYGKAETFTFVLPNFVGSDSDPSKLGDNSNIVQALQESGLPNEAINSFYGGMSPYWGDQPNTSGPVYFGAIVCMLVIAGFFFVPVKYLSWLIPASIFGIVLAWGDNLSSINYFLFDHLPGLNKFRSPSSAMVIPQLTFAIMASLALQQIFYNDLTREQLLKKLKFSGIAIAGLLVILTGFYLTGSFTNERDKRTKAAISEEVAGMYARGKEPTAEMTSQGASIASKFNSALIKDRQDIYRSDLIRLFIYLLLGGVLLWFGANKKLKPGLALAALSLVSFVDLITVDLRYLSKSNFTTKDDYLSEFVPTAADKLIKADTSYFRVFDRTAGDPFQDSRASYFHNSIGGYSPAKLGLYEDLKTYQLQKGNVEVYNMLNTKYVIARNPADPSGRSVIADTSSTRPNGPCWFVKGIRFVNNANEEMLALDSLHTKDSAVIDKREQPKVTGMPQYDSAASIRLVKNLNDEIIYQSSSSANQFAVFSEIYYPYGWNAYIDGKESPVVRTNYALRGLSVPAGNHTIRFAFEPKSYTLASNLNLVAGILSILSLLVCIFLLIKQGKKTEADGK